MGRFRARLLIVLVLILGQTVPTALAAQSDNLATLNRQIAQLREAGRYTEAAQLAERYVALARARHGENREFATALAWLASLYEILGRYEEAEALLRQCLAIRENAFGAYSAIVAETLNNLAGIYESLGRYDEAEPLYKRTLTIAEKVLGPNHKDFATILNNLGYLYAQQDRYEEAEPLWRRTLEIRLKVLGVNHRDTGQSLNNLGYLYMRMKHYEEAEALLKQGLALRERLLGSHHADVAESLTNLASLYSEQGRGPEAEPLFKRSLAIDQSALGVDHPRTAISLNNLASFYADKGRIGEAEQLYKKTLTILMTTLGPDHPNVASTLGNMGLLYYDRKDWRQALPVFRQGADILVRRSRREQQSIGRSLVSGEQSDAQRNGSYFAVLIKTAFHQAEEQPSERSKLAQEMFSAAQWALGSQAASSLAQMAARQAKDDSALGRLVRERQDLVNEWQELDKQLMTLAAQSLEARDPRAQQVQRARLAAIDDRIAEIDRNLARDFPEYSALANPEPLSLAEAQAMLHPDEALVMFLDTAQIKPKVEETFIWVVTRTDLRWVRSDVGTSDLIDQVAALRCGLDAAAWEGESRCPALLTTSFTALDAEFGKPLPFDVDRAHALYQALFGQIEELITDKHLLLLPSGALGALPFQVLTTQKATSTNATDVSYYRTAAWLNKRHALTVLPAVTSLRALRQVAKASKATKPFIGFGNPLLLGPSGNDRRAWDRQSCNLGAPAPVRVAQRSLRGTIRKFFRGNLADVSVVRAQYPLPETADELCAVAQSTGSDDNAVFLGQKATERVVKTLSANGTLADARTVHFATHGLLAGETEAIAGARAEPALLLTPPEQASEEDDGLLTASEIVRLRLDADWVVLSACNTAAGGSKSGVDALSGLARAFFYAGARALLVSHWAVDSDATVRLITKAFDTLKSDSNVGRAEALRRSMLALIESGGHNAHPATWAPFIVVGEGAR